MAERRKNVFLTGATSGIGAASARLLTENGFAVWGTTRNASKVIDRASFHPVEMKLEDFPSIETAWNSVLEQAGQIDVVIQNAGAGIFGSVEEVSLADAHWQWQVLVEGPLQLLKLASAHMRPRREGLIIGVSSLAAEMPVPFSGHYSAGKAAFSALLATMAMELHPFQVNVVDLRPGDINTSFLNDLPKIMPADSEYFPWAQQAWKEAASLMGHAPSPELIAHAIEKIIHTTNAPAVVRSGTFFQATLSPLGVRLLPRRMLLDSIRDYFGLKKIDRQK